MKNSILIIFLYILTCCQNENKSSVTLIKDNKGEVEIAIFKNLPHNIQTEYFELTTNEIKEIEFFINQEIEFKIADFNKKPNDHINEPPFPLEQYYRQYCPFINKQGEKEVIVVCLYKDLNFLDWKEKMKLPLGGGNSVFKGNINLSTKKSLGFSVNAPM